MMMRLPHRSLAAFAFLLCGRVASAQTTGISGTVISSADGTPIVGATVNAYDATRSRVGSVATNGSGVYTISGLLPGTFYLRISQTGFVPTAFNNIPCAAQSCFTGDVLGLTPTPVTVTAGATTTVNVVLDPGTAISGTITKADDHTPVSNILVHLYDASTSPVATVATAIDGTYRITGVAAGVYFARTDSGVPQAVLDVLYGGTLCPGRSTPRCRLDSGTPIVVTAGTPLVTANFSLPRGGTILGSLTDGRPGGGSAFWNYPMALYEGTTLIATSTANSGGEFGFAGLDPGTYFVRTNAGNGSDVWYSTSHLVNGLSTGVCVACPGAQPSPIAVTVDRFTGGVNFLLFPSSGSGISGTLTLHGASTVTDAMTPDVQIYNTDGALVQTWSGTLAPTDGGETVPWHVLVPPGTYYVRTSSYSLPSFFLFGFGVLPTYGLWVDQLYANQTCVAADCDPRLGTPVTVTQGATAGGIDFALDLGAQITGSLEAGFASGATQVEVYDSRGVRLPQRSGTQADEFSSHRYGALGLPAGSYYLVATSLASGVSRVLYNGIPCQGCAVTSGQPVTVTLGQQLSDINFAIIPDRKVSGTIRSDANANPANQPLSTIGVEAYGSNGQRVSSATTLADGTFSMTQLGPGPYTIRTHNTRGFVDQTYASPVVIPSGNDVTGIDFALTPGQTISGEVSAATGAPLSGAGILVYPSSPSSPAAHVNTDDWGFFLANVPRGVYFVQTDPIAGYTQQIYNGVACPQGDCPTASATPVVAASTPVIGINFNLAVCTSGSLAPASLANAAVGIVYRQTLLVSAASGNVRFAVSSGVLPPGLALDPSSGVISGTPTTSGQFAFTVSAIDGHGCAISRRYTLDVPACTFPGPSLLSVPAVGVASPDASSGTVILQSCEDPGWGAAIDVPWMRGGKLPLLHAAPDGTLLHWGIAFAVDPNTSNTSRAGHVTYGSHVLTVLQSAATTSAPFGNVDAPRTGDVVSGSVAVGGWALDDMRVSQVQIYRDPVLGEPSQPIFIGNATFVTGSRPDVETAFPTTPFSDRAGWGYLLLTNMLPNRGNGVFNICAYATDADGNRTLLGVRTITAVNVSATAPFGAIDTPDQGAAISGTAFVNFGWALTPAPKMIPMDGSTVHVLIDGVDVGPVTSYNLFRSDVSSLFPGLRNSGGPIGYRVIDTSALSEGVHTIAWVATDDHGSATGIGSRFFTVQNSAWEPSLHADFAVIPPTLTQSALERAGSTTAVPPRVDGVDLGRQVESLASLPIDVDGARAVTMSNLQALKLSLNATTSNPQATDGCGPVYSGYLIVKGRVAQLPVGSALDPAGTFYWHPGPAFHGVYPLLFVRTSCDGAQQRIPITVTIH